jgi:pimeloyl-ACP methyl ester carboxylesterase
LPGNHMDEMAQDVVQVLQQLKLRRAHIVGSSLGAEVGLSLTANYPEQVISLTCDGALLNESGSYGAWEGTEEEFNQYVEGVLEKLHNSTPRVFDSIEERVNFERESLAKNGWWNEWFEELLKYDAVETSQGKFIKCWQKPAREDYFKHYFHYRLEDYYRRVKCPLLMLTDEEDFQDERKKAAMEGLCRLTPHGQVVPVPGWVHPYSWMLDPQGVSGIVLEFLSQFRK